jgi:hypothetical protein
MNINNNNYLNFFDGITIYEGSIILEENITVGNIHAILGNDCIFDGNYKTITISSGSNIRFNGLFSIISNTAIVKNLKVKVTDSTVFLNVYGGWIGRVNTKGTILNCSADWSDSNNSIGTYIFGGPIGRAGGIVGGYAGNSSTCYISNCYTNGKIGLGGGGIIGSHGGLNGSCIIENCYSLGYIDSDYLEGAGGIAGSFAGSVLNRFDLTEDVASYCLIQNCYSSGLIGGYGGGITGEYTSGVGSGTNSGYNFTSNCTIINCYSLGEIQYIGADPIENSKKASGGIVGRNTSMSTYIINCYYFNNGSNVGIGSYIDVDGKDSFVYNINSSFSDFSSLPFFDNFYSTTMIPNEWDINIWVPAINGVDISGYRYMPILKCFKNNPWDSYYYNNYYDTSRYLGFINTVQDWNSYAIAAEPANYYLNENLSFNNIFSNLTIYNGCNFNGGNKYIIAKNINNFGGLFHLIEGNGIVSNIENITGIFRNVSLQNDVGFLFKNENYTVVNINNIKVIMKNCNMGNRCGGISGTNPSTINIYNSCCYGYKNGTESGGFFGRGEEFNIYNCSSIGDLNDGCGGFVGNNSVIYDLINSYHAGQYNNDNGLTLTNSLISNNINSYSCKIDVI